MHGQASGIPAGNNRNAPHGTSGKTNPQ